MAAKKMTIDQVDALGDLLAEWAVYIAREPDGVTLSLRYGTPRQIHRDGGRLKTLEVRMTAGQAEKISEALARAVHRLRRSPAKDRAG